MITDPKIHIQTLCSSHEFGKDETQLNIYFSQHPLVKQKQLTDLEWFTLFMLLYLLISYNPHYCMFAVELSFIF